MGTIQAPPGVNIPAVRTTISSLGHDKQIDTTFPSSSSDFFGDGYYQGLHYVYR